MIKLSSKIGIFMLLSTMAFAGGTVEIGFESETRDSNDSTTFEKQKQNNFILPYVKTKTFFGENSPYFIEANYSYKHDYEKIKAKRTERDRYEVFIGGYKLVSDRFVFAPKVGVRHEEFNNIGKASETHFKFYPGMSFKINPKNAVSLVGYFEYSESKMKGKDGYTYDKENGDYIHELSLDYMHKTYDKQAIIASLFNKYEENTDVNTVNVWELRFKMNHTTESGRLTVSPYVRLPIHGENKIESGVKKGTKTDINKARVGVASSYKVTESLTTLGEVWYQTQTMNKLPSLDTYFLKLALRYAY
ncbi:hypothetical protein NRK67_17110 (plasmid) [Fusobacteria bacterium ZRK30]|nr:hypothetical protein NRK67_17110 [Fusobacteria bacterium ZRK30]